MNEDLPHPLIQNETLPAEFSGDTVHISVTFVRVCVVAVHCIRPGQE